MRNQSLDGADLTRFGHPLALVRATIRISASRSKQAAFLDLCDPSVLSRYRIRPDTLAASDFVHTQAIAKRLFGTGCVAFRWWSALSGDWHTTVVLHTKLQRGELSFDTPEPLTLRTDAVVEAARRLAIRLV